MVVLTWSRSRANERQVPASATRDQYVPAVRGSRWTLVGVYLVATAVLAAGVIVLVHDRRDDHGSAPSTRVAELASMPFPSMLDLVGANRGRVGSSFSFEARGLTTKPIDSIELWDGSRRIETEHPSGAPAASLTLPALSAGRHTVYAKVVGADGSVSLTAPTAVDVARGAKGSTAPAEVSHDEGESLADLAGRLGVEPETLTPLAPPAGTPGAPDGSTGEPTPLDLSPSDTIPADATVTVTLDGDEGYDAAVSPKPQPSGASDPSATSGGDAGSDAGSKLVLAAEVDGCDVVLSPTGASGSVDLFDGTAGASGWVAVGSVDGGADQRVATPTPGAHVYFARAGAQQSGTVTVTVPSSCAASVGWTGDAALVAGTLTLPKPSPNGTVTWLFLQVDGQPALRVPATGSLGHLGTQTQVADRLPYLTGSSVDLEVWSSNEFNSTKIGSGHLDVPQGKALGDVIGEGQLLALTAGGSHVLSDGSVRMAERDAPITFTWNGSSRVDRVLWQVLTADHPISDRSLAPADSIGAGASIGSTTSTGRGGTFTIDTKDIPGRAATGREVVPASGLTAILPPKPITVFDSSIKTGKGTKVGSGLALIPGPNAGKEAAETPPAVVALPSYGGTVYVRAIAMLSDGAGVGSASKTVPVQLPTPQGTNGTSVDFALHDDFGPTLFDAGRRATRGYQQCAYVTVPWSTPIKYAEYDARKAGKKANTGDHLFAPELMSLLYPTTGTYCPEDFPPPPPPPGEDCPTLQLLCDVWDGITTVVNAGLDAVTALYTFVTTVIDTVVNKIAEVVAKYSGVCQALEGVASGAGKTCGTVIQIAVKAAAAALMASFGIPPLPDLSVLESVAKGDFAAIAVTLMEIAGIPCGSMKADPDLTTAMDVASSKVGKSAGAVAKGIEDPCLAIATAMVATVKSTVTAKAETVVAQAGGLPYYPMTNYGIAGFSMVPSAFANPAPVRIQLRLQPKADNAEASGIACPVQISVDNSNSGPKARWAVVPSTVASVAELPAPNVGRWERTLVLDPVKIKKYTLTGDYELHLEPWPTSRCRFDPVTITSTPRAAAKKPKDRKPGYPLQS